MVGYLRLFSLTLPLLLISAGLANSANAENAEIQMAATGSFDVQMTPHKHDSVDVGRIVIQKQYKGDMVGTGSGQMLTERTSVKGSAGYVAIEHFTGSVNGQTGSFTLQHSGLMNRGAQSLSILIVPDSGNDGLKGISGTMQIDLSNGEHSYALDYQISEEN